MDVEPEKMKPAPNYENKEILLEILQIKKDE
jgi:hypothetical protein